MPEVQVCLVDLPEQCALAQANAEIQAHAARFCTAHVNWLDELAMPAPAHKADMIWMSQFLDCFSPNQAVSILKRAQTLLTEGGRIVVLECLTDAQQWPAAQLSLAATSLYFTTMANGNSRFFRKRDLLEVFERSGLVLEQERSGYGVSHSLFVCSVAS